MSKLTLSVEKSVISKARRYAKRQGVSVSQMVETYLAAVTGRAPEITRTAPTLRSLKGSLKKGDIEDFVQIIQYCNSIRNKRIKDGRLIPVSIDKQLSNAVENIVGELAVTADMDYAKAYASFQRATGLKLDE